MEQSLINIREQQKASWDKFSPGWKKWDALTMNFLKPVGEEMVRLLKPHDAELVLDIAAGTGEPGLTIAGMLKGGKVVMTDLSEDMLRIAREHAASRGITNIETQACDVCELPFPDNTFDAISCRFGFMFFPDMLLAAKEMVRVLKPGGRLATAVWDVPGKNFWVTVTMDAIGRNVELPAPPLGAPGMFRCAGDGFMTDLFAQAGLHRVSAKPVRGKLNAGTADTYWAMMTEVAAPVVGALSKADEATRTKIRQEVFAALSQHCPDGNVRIESSALVVYGEK